jgi:hypothetical protein
MVRIMLKLSLLISIFIIFGPSINTAQCNPIFPPLDHPEEKQFHREHKQNIQDFKNTIDNLPKYSDAWRSKKANLERRLKAIYKVNSGNELPDYYYYHVDNKPIRTKYYVNGKKRTPYSYKTSTPQIKRSRVSFQQMAMLISKK